MPNHIHSRAIMVENGTAPDECLPQMKKFSTKHVPNMMPGYIVAVYKGTNTNTLTKHTDYYLKKHDFLLFLLKMILS